MSSLKNIRDSELTFLVKIGLKEAFQVLFERYAPSIQHFALSYLKNEHDTEELVQDVFLKIWEKRETLDKSKSIKAFVFKIAVNDIYDFIRRRNIENAFKDFVRDSGNDYFENTWHEVIVNEMSAHIDELVKRMPDQQRKIFRLSREEGLSNEKISQQLNISKRTVENQLYRALTFLKRNFHCE